MAKQKTQIEPMKQKNDWHTHFRAFKRRYPFGIKCPYCDAKHYWNRSERVHLDSTGEVPVECCCGGKYKIILNNDGAGVHIRAERKGNDKDHLTGNFRGDHIGGDRSGSVQCGVCSGPKRRLSGRGEGKVIVAKCDRCQKEIEKNGKIGYISWNFKEGIDGDLKGDNPLENCHFCMECMEEIMDAITKPAQAKPEVPAKKKHAPKEKTTRPEVKRPPKGRITDGGKMWALREAGWSNAQIADEFDVSQQAVANWFSRNRNKRNGKKKDRIDA